MKTSYGAPGPARLGYRIESAAAQGQALVLLSQALAMLKFEAGDGFAANCHDCMASHANKALTIYRYIAEVASWDIKVREAKVTQRTKVEPLHKAGSPA
ncbi:hypothetical protein [Altererythrobacter sp. GH1-8]|uniref:hypothetical protein n=1 Tax=Altererythrobacter sp. GH1-8 TaxID=3349333 RepID=UPI00374D6C21